MALGLMITDIDKQFVAGFIDGDGCIQMMRPDEKRQRPIPYITIGQAHDLGEPPELLHIQKLYGGTIMKREQRDDRRQMWYLHVRKYEEVIRLLSDIQAHLIIKASQAETAWQYMLDDRKESSECFDKLSSLKNDYRGVSIAIDKLTDPYLAGLFAAEGCIMILTSGAGRSYRLRVTITQSGCPRILQSIRDRCIAGNVTTNGELHFSGESAAKFLHRISPYLVGQKVPQLLIAIEFQAKKTKGERRLKYRRKPDEDLEEMECAAKRLKQLKRQ